MKCVIRLLAILGASAVLIAQSSTGYQQLTVGTTAVALTASVQSGATLCRGRLETAVIRVLWNGPAPTAAAGQPVQIGDEVVLGNRNDIVNFKAIAANPGNTSGLLNMACSSGTVPSNSVVLSTTTSVANLPVCNPLLRAAGQACR